MYDCWYHITGIYNYIPFKTKLQKIWTEQIKINVKKQKTKSAVFFQDTFRINNIDNENREIYPSRFIIFRQEKINNKTVLLNLIENDFISP